MSDKPFSLALGTVQFGIDYGVANRAGRPSPERVREILAAAWEAGVTVLDTAHAYGNSEEVLGELLDGSPMTFAIATKLPPLSGRDDMTSPEAVARAVRHYVTDSLRRLRRSHLDYYLLHNPADAHLHGGAVMEALKELGAEGLVRSHGLSVYFPEEAEPFAGDPAVGCYQIPMSVFDQRFAGSGFLERASATGATVFVRSVYLQGLLLMERASIPEHLRSVLPWRDRFEALCGQYGYTPAALAMAYPLSLEGVTSVVTGVDTVEQLRENLSLVPREPLPAALCEALRRDFRDFPLDLAIPSRWESLKG